MNIITIIYCEDVETKKEEVAYIETPSFQPFVDPLTE